MSETYFVKADKKDSFTILDTTCIRDSRLSMKAKGLHTYLMSLPQNWKINLSELKTHFSDGKDSINSAIKELISFGYIKKETQERQQTGQFGNSVFYVYEKPIKRKEEFDEPKKEFEPIKFLETLVSESVPKTDISEKSIKSSISTVSEKPSTVKPITENPTLININKVNNEFSKNLKDTSSTGDVQENIQIKIEQQQTAEAEENDFQEIQKIISKVKSLFSNHYVFDSNFAPELYALQKEFSLNNDEFNAYIDFAFLKTTEKKPNSLTNMFYKMAKSQSLVSDFVIQLETQKRLKQATKVVCPVCGNVHAKGIETCPVCEYDFESGDIEYYKSIFTLSNESKSMFKAELNQILSEKMKFNISTLVKNKSLADSFNNQLNALYKKYGINKRLE